MVMKKRWLATMSALMMLLAMPGSAFAASGDLDNSFHGDGINTIDVFPGGGFSSGNAVEVRGGKVVIAGDGAAGGEDGDVIIARLGPNGFRDGTCNNGQGFRVLDLGGRESVDNGLAVLPNGKILIAGYSRDLSSNRSDLFLLRLLPNCLYDPQFAGGNGIFMDDFGYPEGAFPYDLTVLPNGKIIIVGEVDPAENESHVAVWRFNKNGTLDLTFGDGDGLATLDVAPGFDGAWRVIALPNGKIVVGGWVEVDPSDGYDVMLARFHADGAVDKRFGTRGAVRHNPTPEESEYVNAMAVDDGKIIICVPGDGPQDQDVILMRLKKNGARDLDWGRDAEAAADFGGNELCEDIALQPDGKIVVGGSRDNDFMVARFLANGDPDLGFGNGGFNTAAETGSGRGMTLDADGRILVSGFDGDQDLAVARFLP